MKRACLQFFRFCTLSILGMLKLILRKASAWVHATVRENGGGKPFPPVKFIREMNALMILCDTKPYPVKMERASW